MNRGSKEIRTLLATLRRQERSLINSLKDTKREKLRMDELFGDSISPLKGYPFQEHLRDVIYDATELKYHQRMIYDIKRISGMID